MCRLLCSNGFLCPARGTVVPNPSLLADSWFCFNLASLLVFVLFQEKSDVLSYQHPHALMAAELLRQLSASSNRAHLAVELLLGVFVV
jgi:hypothetical protein